MAQNQTSSPSLPSPEHQVVQDRPQIDQLSLPGSPRSPDPDPGKPEGDELDDSDGSTHGGSSSVGLSVSLASHNESSGNQRY